MKRLILLSVVVLTIATAFVSCNKINDPNSSAHQDRLKNLLLQDTLQLYVGETRNVPVTVSPTNYPTDSIRYTSSDTSVLTISNAGLLTAKKVGVSKITLSNLTDTKSISTEATVVPAPIDSLKLGLIAYYPFDNNTADSSGLGNNGTGFNLTTTSDRFGNPNSAYHFDGTDAYISINDNLYMRLYQTDFTMNAWVKLDSYNPSYGSIIFGKRIPGTDNAGYSFSLGGYTSGTGTPTTGLLHIGPGGGTSSNAQGLIPVSLNAWHMVTCVYSYNSETVTFYVDGVLDNVTSGIIPPNASVGANAYIGRDNPNGTDDGYFLQGAIDDIRIYSRAVSNAEVQKLFTLTH